MTNKRLIMLVGIAGCGKSTWAKEFIEREQNVKIISRDEIRFSLVKENEDYFSKESEVFNTYINKIQEALNDENVDIVIADATHLNTCSRKKVLNKLYLKDVTVEAVNFHASAITCLEQNEKREGRRKVPKNVIFDMSRRYSPARHCEGFDIIREVEVEKDE